MKILLVEIMMIWKKKKKTKKNNREGLALSISCHWVSLVPGRLKHFSNPNDTGQKKTHPIASIFIVLLLNSEYLKALLYLKEPNTIPTTRYIVNIFNIFFPFL
jgi:hypothetical protein